MTSTEMIDAHAPPLSSFLLSQIESAAIVAAYHTDDPWNHSNPALSSHRTTLETLKDKLAKFHMKRQDGKCCYCRKQIGQGGPFLRDREHILPKKKYKNLTWPLFNLSVACKRCNMSVKGVKTEFAIDAATIETDAQNPDRYLIVHPNFEKWEDHLVHIHFQCNGTTLVHYAPKPGASKGEYTFDFFKLKELTVESFDEAQGSPSSMSEVARRLKELATQHDQ